MNYIKNKRCKNDYCNICGKMSELTWDHVPPKSSLFQPDMFASILFQSKLPNDKEYMKHYQSGIKYRSICAECNNNVLGKNDSDYKQFVESVHNQIQSKLQIKHNSIFIDESIIVRTRINRVLRAVCGHFLAMDGSYTDQPTINKFIRDYIFNESLCFYENKVYAWIYPYSTVVNARDFAVKGIDIGTHPQGMVSIMSSYPLAFVCSSDDESTCILDDLGKYSTPVIDDEVDVTIHFNTFLLNGINQFKHFAWPLDISNKHGGAMIALTGKGTIEGSRIATRKQK